MKNFLLILFMVLGLNTYAHDFEVDGICYVVNNISDLTCYVSSRNGQQNSYSGDIVIPASVSYNERTFSVTGISASAFLNCKELTSIQLPQSLLVLGSSSFEGCEGLEEILLPTSLTSMGSWVFYKCTNLKELTIPSSVLEVGQDMVYGCYHLNKLIIEDSEEPLKQRHMANNAAIMYVYIGRPLTYGEGLISVISAPFWNSAVKEIKIGENLTQLWYYGFAGCIYLASVDIPDNIESLPTDTFNSCDYLKNIILGKGITEIGAYSFSGCDSLEEIYCKSETPPVLDRPGFSNDNYLNCIVYVPTGSLEAYKEAPYWQDFLLKEWEPAGISSVLNDGMDNNNTIYRVNGTKVADKDNLTPGFYIINGKKVLVR